MDRLCLQKFADSLWPGPPAIELRFVDDPATGKIGELASLSKDRAVIELYPIESVEQSHWVTVVHELAHVAESRKHPDSDDLHGAAFRSEYKRLLHKAVRLYREEPLGDMPLDEISRKDVKEFLTQKQTEYLPAGKDKKAKKRGYRSQRCEILKHTCPLFYPRPWMMRR